MNKTSWLWIAAVPLFSACTPSQDRDAPDAADPGLRESAWQIHADTLHRNANKLAEQEFARLAAAELIYRHTVVEREVENPVTLEKTYILNKAYRELMDAEVEDIYRSESYLYPVTVKIRFDYELFATAERPKTRRGALELAQNDYDFRSRDRYATYRWYRCNYDGEHIGELPPLLPRPEIENIRHFEHEQGAGLLNPYPPGEAPRTYPRRILRPFN